MSVTEESRHRLHQALDRTIGEEEATTLMEHLPPVGWSDVATKTDLDHLRTLIDGNVDHRFDLIESRFDTVDERFKEFDAKIDALDTKIDGLDTKFGAKFDALDAKIDGLDTKFDAKIDGLKGLIIELGKKIDSFDRRFEAQNARMEQQFWQILGLVVAVTLIVFTAIKMFGG
jgi:hypothetical protein